MLAMSIPAALLPPPSRPCIEFEVLPGRGAEPQPELPRVSGRALFIEPLERGCMLLFGPDCPKRCDPLFVGRAISFLPPNVPFCGRLPPNERVEFATLLCAEKKCWFCEILRVVDGAAGRPLAEKLSRLGVTGNLPVEKRAFWNAA